MAIALRDPPPARNLRAWLASVRWFLALHGRAMPTFDRSAAQAFPMVALAAALLGAALPARGQELEPRSYVNTPVGINFVIAGYGYTRGDVVFSPSVPIEDAEVDVQSGAVAYLRAIDVFGLSGKAGVIVPFAEASGSALAFGERRNREVFGLADPTLRLSVNLYGAPALTMEEYAEWEQDLIVGATLNVSPPLGQYDDTKLLNVGTNRWTIKPEIGASQALGERFTAEVSAAAAFFTRNDDFLGGTLEQDPLYSVQAHLVYQMRIGIWAAVDATYYGGGATTTELDEGEALGNVRLGLTVSLPINRFNSIKVYGSTGVYSRTGTDFDAAGVAWQVRWGGGL
jgi:hypothetical protein